MFNITNLLRLMCKTCWFSLFFLTIQFFRFMRVNSRVCKSLKKSISASLSSRQKMKDPERLCFYFYSLLFKKIKYNYIIPPFHFLPPSLPMPPPSNPSMFLLPFKFLASFSLAIVTHKHTYINAYMYKYKLLSLFTVACVFSRLDYLVLDCLWMEPCDIFPSMLAHLLNVYWCCPCSVLV